MYHLCLIILYYYTVNGDYSCITLSNRMKVMYDIFKYSGILPTGNFSVQFHRTNEIRKWYKNFYGRPRILLMINNVA